MSCIYLNCTSGCCNSYGYCPQDYTGYYYSSDYNKCAQYYSKPLNIGIYIGAAIGGLWLLAILIALCCYQYRKKKAFQGLADRGDQFVKEAMDKVAQQRKINQAILMTQQPINQAQINIQHPLPAQSQFVREQSSINGQLFQPYPQPSPVSYMQNRIPGGY